MGRKNVVKSFAMIDAGDMSGNITSETVNTINLDQASIHIYWDGTSPEGEMTVEAQNGDDQPWYTLDFNATMTVTGNTGDMQIVFSEMPFTSIRLIYTRASGTGELNAVITMKVVGA